MFRVGAELLHSGSGGTSDCSACRRGLARATQDVEAQPTIQALGPPAEDGLRRRVRRCRSSVHRREKPQTLTRSRLHGVRSSTSPVVPRSDDEFDADVLHRATTAR
jgi:hypothetical protein